DAEPVVLTAGVARFDPRTRRFEVFAEGTSNPWGVDFDAHGHAFVSACVIDHLFHLAPGGIYQRQAGQAPFPFAYENLPSIVDHRHHMAAYAGICIYQGDQWPAAWRGATLHGNIHQHALNVDILRPRGASFVASKWNESGDFLTTADGWFMPVSQQVGPDGAVWVMDWYDKYPCYQNANADPAGVDREHGRIWRVVWTGEDAAKPVPSRPQRGMDLAKLPAAELVKLLAHPNVWHRRTAQRLLSERRDHAALAPLRELFSTGPGLDARLAAFWTLYGAGFLDDATLARAAADREPAVRLWAARFLGEQRVASEPRFELLLRLAADPEPTVRSAVATACRQFVSGQLTVNTPPPPGVSPGEIGPVLAALIQASRAGDDRTLNFQLWMAAEPMIVAGPESALAWLGENGGEFLPLAGLLTTKTLRRLCDTRAPAELDLAVEFLDRLPAAAPLARFALEGLIAGQRGKAVAPTRATGPALAKFLASPDADIAARARELGSLGGDAAAFQAGLARLQDPAAPEAERLAAIRTAAAQQSDDARRALHAVVAGASADALKVEAVRGLQQIGVDDTAKELLAGWALQTPAVRRAVAELCTTRWQ
ncbi:MAG TPA: dehydrogenase, partial [Verrucomicrobiota bacterium]|nr:dehydrogenase [Verrucomicrobiota bacterium]